MIFNMNIGVSSDTCQIVSKVMTKMHIGASAYEACFIRQRSLLHGLMKQASFFKAYGCIY